MDTHSHLAHSRFQIGTAIAVASAGRQRISCDGSRCSFTRIPWCVLLRFSFARHFRAADFGFLADLEKLFVLGSGRIQRGRVCLERAYTPACLRRIDLKFVNIVCWPSSLPTVQILTLDEVSFDPEEDLDICKDFFSSLPGLESLGLNGIDRLNPSSLAQLKTIGSITRLYLGPKCFLREDAQPRSQLLESLTRYFRPKIKHLVLPSKLSSLSLVAALLNTRSGNHHPLYLSRLSTITVSVDRKLEHLQVQLEARILEMLKQKGIDNVALKRWMPWESDSLVSWEP